MTPAEIVALAQRFHDEYEKNAPNFGYTTREDTRAFDITSPNGQLMVAVVQAVMVPAIRAAVARERERAANAAMKEINACREDGCTDLRQVRELVDDAIRMGE